MRAVVQRARSGSVRVGGRSVAEIGVGLAVFLGVARADDMEAAGAMAGKIRELRIFQDAEGRMNRALSEAGGEVLLVPQFTVMGDARRGHRPSFHAAAGKEEGARLFAYVGDLMEGEGVPVRRGIFGADMEVWVQNDGPVTILLDTERRF